MTVGRAFLLGCLLAVSASRPAAGQGMEAVGLRALGMGGAFVAVADDASATYWNPAGLVTGDLFSAVAEYDRARLDAAPLPGSAGEGLGLRSGTLVAVGTWPVGATFYRLTSVAARIPAASGASPAGPPAELTRLTTTQVGVNVLQSLATGLHVGATIKYLHGSAASALVAPVPGDPLDAAADLPTRGSHRADVDAGVMADLRRVKLGLTARNLFEPEFDADDGSRAILTRQVRAGAAFRATDTLILSLDADLTRSPDVTGDLRSLAGGAEQRFRQGKAAVRGGFRVSTTGEARPVLTTGGSVAIRSGLFADGYVAVGLDRSSADGFGLGVRMVF
ncbi:hypothetical protein TBR22_A37980 [Luteitalea sp. TBR-22]|uniref:conjugal transfer protein TraF n=1 Tax=Luteitalea sp. TBR-22 TaxID=2802971 RepID=UPI001AF7BE2E|nr:conjugal transfer protein TraF [Luteitalea sp. TBR-22]BCS34570.1 hypothetical protein TBR22_A37980 [Luteitalea sp. TBR-22]